MPVEPEGATGLSLIRKGMHSEIEGSFDAVQPADRVVERTEVWRIDVLLNIARVEMVERVVYFESRPELEVPSAKCEIERVLQHHIQSDKGWQTARLISIPDKPPILINF